VGEEKKTIKNLSPEPFRGENDIKKERGSSSSCLSDHLGEERGGGGRKKNTPPFVKRGNFFVWSNTKGKDKKGGGRDRKKTASSFGRATFKTYGERGGLICFYSLVKGGKGRREKIR